MDKLRLLLFENCNRSCPKCVNKQHDLSALPEVESYEGYKEIMLTGGEPMLSPTVVKSVAKCTREQNPEAFIALYTAKIDKIADVLSVLECIDGLTVTLHTQADVDPFLALAEAVRGYKKSFRVNIFKGVVFHKADIGGWTVKTGIEWIDDCPLPAGEEFKRL